MLLLGLRTTGSCRVPRTQSHAPTRLAPLRRYSWNQSQLERYRSDRAGRPFPASACLLGVLSTLPTATLAVAAVACMGDTRGADGGDK